MMDIDSIAIKSIYNPPLLQSSTEGDCEFYAENSLIALAKSRYFLRAIVAQNLERFSSTLYLPEFICVDFVEILSDIKVNIIFYPVTESLQPSWEEFGPIKSGMFLYVNYFG